MGKKFCIRSICHYIDGGFSSPLLTPTPTSTPALSYWTTFVGDRHFFISASTSTVNPYWIYIDASFTRPAWPYHHSFCFIPSASPSIHLLVTQPSLLLLLQLILRSTRLTDWETCLELWPFLIGKPPCRLPLRTYNICSRRSTVLMFLRLMHSQQNFSMKNKRSL